MSLPPKWTDALLSELAVINPPNPDEIPDDRSLVSFVPMTAVEAETGRLDPSTARPWAEVKSGFTKFQEGDVVLAKITPSMENGKAALAAGLVGGVAAGTTELHVFRARGGVSPKFILLYLLQESFRRRARARMTGTAGQLRVPTKFLAEERLPLPPSSEQTRIVDALDSLLSRLDAAEKSLEQAQAKLKAYRASVLKAAVEGRLVPTEAELARQENRSYEPAQVLLERILKERRRRWEESELSRLTTAGKTPKNDKWKAKYKEPESPDTTTLPELPEGWCWASVEHVGRVQLGRQRTPIHHRGRHMRPYLRVANVFEDRIDVSDVKEMNFTPTEFETFRLEPGDILLNEGQSPHLIGRPAMYRGEVPGACFQNTLIRFQAFAGVDARFALVVFRAFLHCRRFMQEAQITTNIAHLGAGRFAAIEFPVPPEVEQGRIADEVERLLSVVDAVDSGLEGQQLRARLLRQAILKWAFEGRLVDQDPTDEPAEKLLARIRAERQAEPVKRGRRKRTA